MTTNQTVPFGAPGVVRMFGKATCLFCVRARMLMWWRGIEFEWIDVTGQDEVRLELARVTGQKTVPQIFLGPEAIGGFTDLAALDASGELPTKIAALKATPQAAAGISSSAII